MLVSVADEDDKVVLSMGVRLGDEQKVWLERASEEARAELALEVGVLLHMRSSQFSVEDDDGVMQRVGISKSVYSDGFTKDRLMSAVNELFATHSLLVLKLGEYFVRSSPRPMTPEPGQVRRPPPTQTPPQTQQVSAGSPSNAFCSSCGKPTTPGQKFCRFCGQAI